MRGKLFRLSDGFYHFSNLPTESEVLCESLVAVQR